MSKESWIVKFLRYGLYVVAFVPLVIFNDFLSPFHFGKVLVFRTLIEILLPFYLILIWKDRSYLPKTDKVVWAFLLFTLAFTLTTTTSVLRFASVWGYLERMGGLWTFWHYFAYFVILISVFRTKEQWLKMLDTVIIVGILSALYGFGQKTDAEFFIGGGGRERIFGTIGNAALFAGYQIIVAFLSLTLFFQPGNSLPRRLFLGFGFLIVSVALLMTAVRGSLLGYGVGIITFVFLWFLVYKTKVSRLIFTYMLAAVALAFVFVLLFKDVSFVQNSRYLRRISDLSFTSPTVMTRYWAWEAGLKGWSESPKKIILGWGPENFNIPFAKHFNPNFYVGPGSETLFDRAHNMFVEILVTMGLVGLFAYVLIFISIFKYLSQARKVPDKAVFGIGLVALTVSYIIHNSFIFDTSANFIVFFTVLGFISFIHSGVREETRASRHRNRQGMMYVALIIMLAAVSLLIYKTSILPAKANYATTRAIIRSWGGDFVGAIEKFREALTYDVPGKYEFRHRFSRYLINSGANRDDEFVQETYKYAIEVIQKNIDENPPDYLPLLYASRLNIMLGITDPDSEYNDIALKHSLDALEISPTFIRTYFEIAQVYLNKKDRAKAIEYFQKALELNPDTRVSYWYVGVALLEGGDMSGIDYLEEAIVRGYPPSENDYLRLINLYIETEQIDKIIEIYEILVDRFPRNPQSFASLATAYANVGRYDDAEAAARKAAELDPENFAGDAKIFLESIGREL
jgi:O-antigen ligase